MELGEFDLENMVKMKKRFTENEAIEVIRDIVSGYYVLKK
jgi:hypothetical protein